MKTQNEFLLCVRKFIWPNDLMQLLAFKLFLMMIISGFELIPPDYEAILTYCMITDCHPSNKIKSHVG